MGKHKGKQSKGRPSAAGASKASGAENIAQGDADIAEEARRHFEDQKPARSWPLPGPEPEID